MAAQGPMPVLRIPPFSPTLNQLNLVNLTPHSS